MESIEAKLQERIKELRCLYEVTSIIVNSDFNQLDTSLEAICYCLKRALKYGNDSEVLLKSGGFSFKTEGVKPDLIFIKSDIKVFNQLDGFIKIGYPNGTYRRSDFLEEEETLLKNVALALGSLFEKKQVHDSEMVIKRQVEHVDRLHILGEITAGIAHELNTPLANILGFAELLKDRLTDREALRDLDKIVANAIFSREVVKKMMFFACEMPQRMKLIPILPLIENVINLLGPSLSAKNIKLKTSLVEDQIELKADTVQLTQVLFNLIMNAVYFSPDAGEIGISLKHNAKMIQIAITDQGSGIDSKNGDKVFQPFFTTKPLGSGSGLGLSVVHGIISSHKGTITHSPNSPKGTVFTIELPKL